MSHEHDSGYRYLFSAPEMVRDLILGFVPDEWLHSLDYSTLERVDGSYIMEDFRTSQNRRCHRRRRDIRHAWAIRSNRGRNRIFIETNALGVYNPDV